jgi:hypothetical protein
MIEKSEACHPLCYELLIPCIFTAGRSTAEGADSGTETLISTIYTVLGSLILYYENF